MAENSAGEHEFKDAATTQEKHWPGNAQNLMMRK
jgi:hypothetical protein